MPGAQDRWDQLTEPSVRSQEATPPDRSRLADRPERGSLADLRQRLERLPAGHPSSPYNDDLTRKLPVTSLKDLELPLQGTERDLNGAAKHYEHGLAEGASHNGVGGRGLDADTLSTSGWTSVTDVEDAADALADADGVSAPEDLGAPETSAPATAPRPKTSVPRPATAPRPKTSVPRPATAPRPKTSVPRPATAPRPMTSAPPTAWGGPTGWPSRTPPTEKATPAPTRERALPTG